MKLFNTTKKLLLASLIGFACSANGQLVVRPLAFGVTYTGSPTNWYKDYVGQRIDVDAPASIAGDKYAISAVIGTAAGDWPNIIDTDLYDLPIVMPNPWSDSCFETAMVPGSMYGKIAVVWRGPLSSSVSPVTFSQKAWYAQQAGALAIIIINEYPGAEPFAPGSTAGIGGTLTIPVFMIGNLDGIAITNQYKLDSNSVRMTITNWGHGLNNDLGFVPNGYALWQDYAIPADQITSGINPAAYKGLDGSFIANYGANDAWDVQLTDSVFFTPNGGSTVYMRAGSELLPAASGAFTGTASTTPDSILAMFSNAEYDLYSSDITTTSPGRYDIKYNITSDSTDQYPQDNSVTYSFYTTDSLYSEARYDFVNNVPDPIEWESFAGGADFTYGPMFYVAKGGSAVSRIQYSIAENTTAPGTPLSSPTGGSNVYIFKWVDGYFDTVMGVGHTMDSIVQTGELILEAIGTYNYSPLSIVPSDTSEGILNLTVNDISSPDGLTSPYYLILDSNSSYYFAVDPQSSTSNPTFVGIDKILNPYPRIFGRFYNNHYLQYSNFDNPTFTPIDGFSLASPGDTNCAVLPATITPYLEMVDSFNFNSVRGLIPSVAVIVNKNPPRVAVNNVKKPFADVVLYPIPANDQLNVSLQLDNQASSNVTYTILDGLGRVVSRDVHYNVQSDNFIYNTTNFAPGSYYLIINALGKVMSKKFIIAK